MSWLKKHWSNLLLTGAVLTVFVVPAIQHWDERQVCVWISTKD